MTRFRFVIASNGQRANGYVQGNDAAEATDRASRPGWILLSLQPESSSRSLRQILAIEIGDRKILPTPDFLSIAREWSTLVGSGVPLLAALQLSARGRKGRADLAVRSVCEAVRGGSSLQAALLRSEAFPASFVALVGAAEAGGTLAQTLAQVVSETDANFKTSKRLLKELIYPAFLTVTAVAAILVLLVVVVPTLEAIIGEVQRRLLL